MAHAAASSAPVLEVVDEVIVEHPTPPLSPYAPGSRLAARGPVHTALTASIRNHYPALPAAQQSAEGLLSPHTDAENPPPPQVRFLLNALKHYTLAYGHIL